MRVQKSEHHQTTIAVASTLRNGWSTYRVRLASRARRAAVVEHAVTEVVGHVNDSPPLVRQHS